MPGDLSVFSGSPVVRSYPANAPPPVTAATLPGQTPGGGPGNAPPEQPLNFTELFRTLRGKAEINPEGVRRTLLDTCQKKEHFSGLLSLAQIAAYSDPDLGSIAVEVARGADVLLETVLGWAAR